MKKVAILQSNYIPWKGYFDIINDVDLFIFYDEVQYTKRDWRSRNVIYTPNGLKWLSVPVTGSREMAIDEVKIADKSWQKSHFGSIQASYSRAPYWKKYREFMEYVYLERDWDYLYQVNRFLIETVSREILKSKTEFTDCRNFRSSGRKHEKLLNLARAAGAEYYLSGAAAKDYIIEEDYAEAGIELAWKDYDGYPEYRQLHEPFVHTVSIIDLIMNTGEDAPYYIWGWREA